MKSLPHPNRGLFDQCRETTRGFWQTGYVCPAYLTLTQPTQPRLAASDSRSGLTRWRLCQTPNARCRVPFPRESDRVARGLSSSLSGAQIRPQGLYRRTAPYESFRGIATDPPHREQSHGQTASISDPGLADLHEPIRRGILAMAEASKGASG